MSTPTSPDSPDLSFEATLRGLKSGQKVFGNRYTLLRLLGRGGMGVVWLARDDELGRDIALKFLPEYVATDKAAMQDLKEETKKTLDLTHPHIVRTYTFLTDAEAEMAAIAMEHVDGLNLSDLRLDQESRVFEVMDAQFQRWVGHLCGALAYAHAKKRIVHRDLKPSNLMVNSEGELKVSDFGIARSLTESRTRLSRQSGASGGTLPYMSPQQALGERPTESDDIYSLGATLYELLTGKPPFYSGEIFEQIKTKEPPPITERRAELNVQSNQPVPDQWERAVLACLAKKPADRPASIAALARLLNLEGDFPESAKHPGVLDLGPAFRAGARPGANSAGQTTSHGGKPPGGKRWLATALQGAVALIIACAVAWWWFGMEKPKRDRADSLVAEAKAAFLKDDRAAAQKKLTEALALMPAHPGASQLRTELDTTLQEAIERALGKADSALARKDMLAAREAYAEVLTLRADHPRASSGLAGLKEVVGGLEVKTSPAGAKVQVGGLDSAISPCTLKALPLGLHRVTLALEGYDPVTEEITLRNDSFVPFDQKLVRQRGAWKIESTPTGMDYSVKMTASVIKSDDELKFTKTGKTPITLENLPTGDYEVKLTRPGWPEAVSKVSIAPTKSESFTHEFAEGTLTLDSTPPGMEASFLKADGTAFASGKTPLIMKAVPTGPGYRVSMKRTGWPDFEKKDVTIVKGSNPSIAHEFAQGSLVITSLPSEADAEFLGPDGKPIATGKTPLTVKDQPVGPGYTALLRRIGWPVNKLDVTITKGENTANAEFAEGSLRVESTPPGCEFEVRAVSEELDTLKKELTEKEARYAVKGLSKDENATLKVRLGELRELIAKQEVAFKPRTGKTPMDVTALPTGSHEVTVRREGWPDFVKTVQVVKGGKPVVTREFIEGTLIVESTPSGATVKLGARTLGVTPLKVQAPSGRLQLALSGPVGYSPTKLSGDLEAHGTVTLKAKLERLPYADFLGRWDFLHSGGACRIDSDDTEFIKDWDQMTTYTVQWVEFYIKGDGTLGYRSNVEWIDKHSYRAKNLQSSRWETKASTSRVMSPTPGKTILHSDTTFSGTSMETDVLDVSYLADHQIVQVAFNTRSPGIDDTKTTLYYRLDSAGEKLFPFGDKMEIDSSSKLKIIKANFSEYGQSWMEGQVRDHMVSKRTGTMVMQNPLYAKRAR